MKNEELKISEVGVDPASRCSVGLIFFVNVNNTSVFDDFHVELVPDQCCLEGGSSLDCNVLEVVGNCLVMIPKGKSSTLKLVAPILDPFERKGYCIAYLDSKSELRKRKVVTMRDAIKIPFDTRLKKLNHVSIDSGIQHCKGIDEDPLDECKPVDCDLFYNGKKSYYSKVKKRCVEVPRCVSDRDDMTNTVYDPISNACIHEESITKDDFDYIKGMKHSNKADRVAKDIVIISKTKNKTPHGTELDKSEAKKSHKAFLSDSRQKESGNYLYMMTFFKYIQNNKTGVILLIVIIFMQCALICIMVYHYTSRCLCKRKKKLEHNYFNYRQDVSVTTPLIGVTTIDTETTTCQFMSESSHVDRKIQDYKACQKDNAKSSLSDDILSKCLNRRNWDRKPVKSEAVNDTRNHYDGVDDTKMRYDCPNNYETLYLSAKTEDQKLVYDNDVLKSSKADKAGQSKKKSVRKDDSIASIYKKTDDDSRSKDFMSEREIQCHTYQYKDSKHKMRDYENPINIGLSEKEILCHNYNYGVKELSDDESIKAISHSYSGIQSNSKKQNVYTAETKNDAVSTGRQVSAQASFANDSIDDYLSERGMTFLACENISKYSFSDHSIKSVSARTSKSNIMKRVLSYLKREKNGPASEPSKSKKEEKNKDLELIHMSKVTMYSSSNNGNECLKNVSRTRLKDSRTSL
ncbi:hypothetical protein O0L34_g12251 [Tuta absoluta]|nr:hypothetical protein O0L34_g12251 [Tuta absoluta]